jgi:molecular chaperone DnaJ
MSSEPNYYSILGVERTAGKEAIVSAYRRMAMKWHPDRHHDAKTKIDAERQFKEIQQAYSTLSDEVLKERYDSTAGAGYHHPGNGRPGFTEDTDSPFGQSFWRETWRQKTEKPESERNWREHLPKGKDLKKKLSISIAEAMHGGRVAIEESNVELCGKCDGQGELDHRCSRCNGSGYAGFMTCFTCRGAGSISKDCAACDGKGKIKKSRTFQVKTPSGTVDGSILVAAGKGKPSNAGGLAGDLILTIAIRAKDGWKCKGSDLHGTLKISFSTAMLGGRIDVVLPTGKTLQVAVPERTNSGKKIRLAGQGLYDARNKLSGDAILAVSIVLPSSKRKLTPEMERFLRSLDARQ